MGAGRGSDQIKTDYLLDCVRDLPPTGPEGFEGLIRDLLEKWTGFTFRLARSGSQRGHDARVDTPGAIEILVEGKRFRDGSSLSSRQLAGELVEGHMAYPNLELWVLASSKEVGSNEAGLLASEAQQRGVEVFILDPRSNRVGPLQAFLAAHPAITVAFIEKTMLAVDRGRLVACLDRVQKTPGFSEAVERLQRDLSGRLLGFADARKSASGFLFYATETTKKAMNAFGEDIALRDQRWGEPIRRAAISAALDKWWTTEDAPGIFCLLGEEGTGKTWAAMDWLMGRSQENGGPLPLTATPKKVGPGGLKDIVVDALKRSASWESGTKNVSWERRLDRWLESKSIDQPRLLLILDGLSEKPDLNWADILWEAGEDPWSKKLFIVATCRPTYWNRHLETRGISAEKHTTEGFTDNELHFMVQRSGHTLDHIPDDLKPLIRKPRYCRIVLDNFGALLDSGELTVERLLYIDYHKRYEQKLGQPLDKKGFDEVLAALASRCLDEWKCAPGEEIAFNSGQLRSYLPGDVEARAALQEIIDGGLMVESGLHTKGYRVEARRLVHGLGMLLADELRKKNGEDVGLVTDQVRVWFEPQPDMDMKASILGAAVFFSLSEVSPSYPVIARQALIREWISARNLSESQQKEIGSYLPSCVTDVLDVADYFWRDDINDRLAQDRLAQAFLGRRGVEVVDSALIPAIERWLGYVHINGDPLLRGMHENNPDRPSPREKLRETFGCELTPGKSAQFEDWEFPVTEHDGHLRLAGFALLLISVRKRRPFASAFLRWAVSRQLMGYSKGHEEVSWTLRLTDEDLWPSLGPQLIKMSGAQNEIVRMAARVLGGCLGVPERGALSRESKGDDPAGSRRSNLGEHDDICMHSLAWTLEDCEKCLGRKDIDLRRLVSGATKFCTNPSFQCPPSFTQRLRAETGNLEVDRYHAQRQQTQADMVFDVFSPALARFAPKEFGKVWRRVVRSLESRDLEGQRFLSFELASLVLVLGEDERELLDIFVKDQGKTHDSWPDRQDNSEGSTRKWIEAFSFIAFSALLQPEEVVHRLLERPLEGAVLLKLENWIEPLPDDEMLALSDRLLVETDDRVLARLLWVLSLSQPAFNNNHRERIFSLSQSRHSAVQTYALSVALTSGDAELAEMVISCGSEYRESDGSRASYLGQVLLCRYASRLDLKELIKRIPLASLGFALVERGTQDDEIDVYAELINKGLNTLRQDDDQPIFPGAVLETDGRCDAQRGRYEMQNNNSRPRYSSANSTWGGTAKEMSIENLKRAFSDDPNDFDERQSRFSEELSLLLRQDVEGWRSSVFDVDCMRAVCARQPVLVKSWVEPALKNDRQAKKLHWVAGSLYQSLVRALAYENPTLALQLWRALVISEFPVRLMNENAGTDWIKCVPFEMPESEEAVAARQTMLADANSDLALLELVTAAVACGCRDWLLDVASKMIDEPPFWHRAKGLMIVAMVGEPLDLLDSLEAQAKIEGSWVEDVMPYIRAIGDRNSWAQHWYRQFLTSTSRDEAFAGFSLFLRCVDRRWILWAGTLEEEARETTGFEELRIRYRKTIKDRIKKAVDKNEKDIADRFLTMKYSPGEIVGLGR